MENYPKTVRVAAIGGLTVLLTLVTIPFLATPVFATWVILLFLAHRQDYLNMVAEENDDDDDDDDYQDRENPRDQLAFFLGGMSKNTPTETKTSAPKGTTNLTPEQEKTLELLAAELKQETDKEFDPPIPLTWDTFNPFRWRKHK